MWIYLALLIVVLILLVVFIISLAKLSHKIISKFVKNKKISWGLSFIPLLLFIIGFFIDFTNAIVVDLHLIIIIFLTKLVFSIIKKISKREINEYISIGVGTTLSIIVLVYGYYLAHNVVETDYEVFTSKDISTDNFRIVQVSDSHLGTTLDGKEFAEYMEKINLLEPDIVVVTGDFVDDNSPYEDMVEAAKGLGKLKTKYGVYFIYGNHDKGYYNNRSYKDEDIRRELKANNVTILEDEYVNITDNIVLIGRQDAEVRDRASIQDLTKDLDKSKFLIVLDHQPNDYENEKNSNVDLVLSGHTHGGQLIPLGQLGVLLGANDKVYGIEKQDNTTFIVNSGISDWAIKFKTGTVSEYGVIDIKK